MGAGGGGGCHLEEVGIGGEGMDTPLVTRLKDPVGTQPSSKGKREVLCQLVVPWASPSLMGTATPLRHQYSLKLPPLPGSRKWSLGSQRGVGWKREPDPGLV